MNMMIRKWTALAVAAVLVASVATTAVAAPPFTTIPGAVYADEHAKGLNRAHEAIFGELQKHGVKDVKADDYFAGSITVLLEAGLLQPDANGNLNPNGTLSDDDGIAIFARVLGVASKTDTSAQATEKARQAGLLGDDITLDGQLSRLEVAKLLGRALGINPKPVFVPAGFPFVGEFEQLSPDERGLLQALYEFGVFKGYPDRTFRPGNTLTRAEIAILVDRILGGQ